MGRLRTPIGDKSLDITPPVSSAMPLGDEVIQTLSVLLGLHGSNRLPLRASASGVLYSSSPRLVETVHIASTGVGSTKQADNAVCTELLLQAHPDNVGRIWVRTRKTATNANAFPLDKGDVINFSVENLSDLHILFEAAADKLIVGYSL